MWYQMKGEVIGFASKILIAYTHVDLHCWRAVLSSGVFYITFLRLLFRSEFFTNLLKHLQYSSPSNTSRNTHHALSSVIGVSVGILSTSPNWTSSKTKYNESSNGSSSTSTNLTTFGWSNCWCKWLQNYRLSHKLYECFVYTFFSTAISLYTRSKYDVVPFFGPRPMPASPAFRSSFRFDKIFMA